MKPRIQLSKENKEQMIKEIKGFFLKERDEEIGDLAASLFLNFVIENLAATFYNQGVEDCIVFMKDKLDDLYGLEI